MELPNNFTKEHKSNTIYSWKKSGLIYHNFDELYEVYIKTMNCQHCNKEFPNNYDRCLDHDHETGMFRKIVCRGCNTRDRYINHPNGYKRSLRDKRYREKNKEKINTKRNENKEIINAKAKEKISCECGSKVSKSHIAEHKRSMKHLDWFMNYVD